MNSEDLRSAIVFNLLPYCHEQKEVEEAVQTLQFSQTNFSSIGMDLIREILPSFMFRDSRHLFDAVWNPCVDYFKENPSALMGQNFLFNTLLGTSLFKKDGYPFNRIQQFHSKFVQPCLSAEALILIGSHTPGQNEDTAQNCIVFGRYNALYQRNLAQITSDSLSMKQNQKFKIWDLMQAKMSCRRFYKEILLKHDAPFIFLNHWLKNRPSPKDQRLLTTVLMELPRYQLVQFFSLPASLKCLQGSPLLQTVSDAVLEGKLLTSVNPVKPNSRNIPKMTPGRF